MKGGGPAPEVEHVEVKASADPGIGGGILDLGLGELTAGPVRNLGSFGDPKIEEKPGKAAESGVEDSCALGQVGDFDKSPGLEILQTLEFFDIISDGDTGLNDIPVGKEIPEIVEPGQLLYLEEPDRGFPSQLNEGGLVILAFFKGGPGLGIKAKNGFLTKGIKGVCEAGGIVYEANWAFVGFEGEGIDLLFGNLDRWGHRQFAGRRLARQGVCRSRDPKLQGREFRWADFSRH